MTTTTACKATTKSGEPCQAAPLTGEAYCFAHHPDMAEQRRQAASKGGRHGRRRSPTGTGEWVTIRNEDDVLLLIERAVNDALKLDNSIARGRLLGYLAGQAFSVFSLKALTQHQVKFLQQAMVDLSRDYLNENDRREFYDRLQTAIENGTRT